jgi:hypothetical protein
VLPQTSWSAAARFARRKIVRDRAADEAITRQVLVSVHKAGVTTWCGPPITGASGTAGNGFGAIADFDDGSVCSHDGGIEQDRAAGVHRHDVTARDDEVRVLGHSCPFATLV